MHIDYFPILYRCILYHYLILFFTRNIPLQTAESSRNATFRFHEETHTVGNALRHILARKPETEYVAYTIPHPSEPYLNLRLQTYDEPAQTVLLDGLRTLGDVADCILAEFERAVSDDMTDE